MKFQLDTTNLQIILSEPVNTGELFDTLTRLFPNGEWRKFEFLYENTPVVITYPPVVIINNPTNPYQPTPWHQQPWITCESNDLNYVLNSGVFEIQTSAE
jgi:hypothetical protein